MCIFSGNAGSCGEEKKLQVHFHGLHEFAVTWLVVGPVDCTLLGCTLVIGSVLTVCYRKSAKCRASNNLVLRDDSQEGKLEV